MTTMGWYYLGSLLYLAVVVSLVFALIEEEGVGKVVRRMLINVGKLLALLGGIGVVVFILSQF